MTTQNAGHKVHLTDSTGFSALCVSPLVAEMFARAVNARLPKPVLCTCCGKPIVGEFVHVDHMPEWSTRTKLMPYHEKCAEGVEQELAENRADGEATERDEMRYR